MPNNGLLSINGNVIDSTPPNEIADIVNDAVTNAIGDLNPTLVHKAGDGTTPEEITGIKDFSYGHDHQQDDNNPSIRAARLRITGQVSPTASQKTVSQVDFYIGNESVAYMGCTRQNGTTFIKVASNNDSAPLIFGYKPFQDNTACIRFEKGHPVWRGGQTGTYSDDKALAVVGDIDKKIDDRFSLNPPTANRVLVSDGKGKISPSTVTTTELDALSALSDILTPKQFKYAMPIPSDSQYGSYNLVDPNGTYFNSSGKCLVAGLYYIHLYRHVYGSSTGVKSRLTVTYPISGTSYTDTYNDWSDGTDRVTGCSATLLLWLNVNDVISYSFNASGAIAARSGLVHVIKII